MEDIEAGLQYNLIIIRLQGAGGKKVLIGLVHLLHYNYADKIPDLHGPSEQ